MIKIKELIKKGESEKVEFKPSLSQTDKIMESISAFSLYIKYNFYLFRTQIYTDLIFSALISVNLCQ